MSEELKPCPFCGSTKIRIIDFKTFHGEKKYKPSCGNCQWHGTGVVDQDAYEDAVDAWNRRPAPDWSDNPPTEPGWYWIETVPTFDNIPCEIRMRETEEIRGTHFYLSIELFGHPKERPLEFFLQDYPNARWLKIEEPEVKG